LERGYGGMPPGRTECLGRLANLGELVEEETGGRSMSQGVRWTLRLLALALAVLLATPLMAPSAAAETTECGTEVGAVDLSSQTPAEALAQEADRFYDHHFAALHEQLNWMSLEDFCATMRYLVDTGAELLIEHGVKSALAGGALTGDQRTAFEIAWQAAKAGTADPDPANLPSQIPAVGPAQSVVGFTIQDVTLGGTWARSNPDDGSWYSSGNMPSNGSWWYNNGVGVAADCSREASPYSVHFEDRVETWVTWFHITDGKWIPAAAVAQTSTDGPSGLPGC